MKKLPVLIFIIILFAVVAPVSIQAEEKAALTLKEAVLKAVGNHPTIKAEKMVYSAQKEAVDNALSGLLPSLDLTMDTGYEDVHNTLTRTRKFAGLDDDDHRGLWYNTQTLSMTQLLYDGSFSKSKYKAQGHRLESSKIFVENSADQVALQAIESYMDILRSRKIIRFAKENITHLKELRSKTRMRLEKGKGTVTDVDRVQLTLSDANVLLVNYEGILQNAKDRFAAVTLANPNLITRQTIKIDLPFGTVDDAIELAIKENPSLLAARSNIRQKESDLKTSKALYHPKVKFIAQAVREENIEGLKDVDHSISGFVRVDYNLFKSGGDRASIYQNASLLSEAQYREEELLLTVQTNVRFEFNNMLTAEKQIPLLEKKVEQNVKVLEGYKEQFLVGRRDIMDVIEAQKMLFTFQAALENMEIEKKLTQFRMLAITGQLFKTLGIDFNPES